MRWYLAKYVPDLRREEPRNIGVLVVASTGTAAAFAGELHPGQIDGRRVRGLVKNVDTYKAWVDVWRHWLENPGSPMRDAVLRRRPGDQYFLEPAGERLVGEEPADLPAFAQQLFDQLVRGFPEERPRHAPHPADRSPRDVWKEFVATVRRKEALERLQPHTVEGERYTERFEYAWKNGVWHAIRPVSLIHHDPERIRTRAAHLTGRMFALQPQRYDTHVYLLLGLPRQDLERQRAAAEDAVLILKDGVEEQKIARLVRESERPDFAKRLEEELLQYPLPSGNGS